MNEQKLTAWWELARAQADLEIARASQVLLGDVIGELKRRQLAVALEEEPARAAFQAAWRKLRALGVPEAMLRDMVDAWDTHGAPPWVQPPAVVLGGNGEVQHA